VTERDTESDERFDQIVHAYYQAIETGGAVDPEAFIRQHAEHESQLRSFFADLHVLDDFPGVGTMERTVDRSGSRRIRTRIPSFASGDRVTYIGQYRLLEEIARGGMGVVFKARQEKLSRVVALKMILSGPLASSIDIDRFRREARAAAGLQHPNIVSVHEIGRHEGHYFFTMDYVDSDSLAVRLREGSLSAEESARLVETIARAMHYAHGEGVLHRDLKPANILIDESGQPHITDFGLAKAHADVDHETLQEMTRTGQILGTPSYMSPEQASGKPELIDVRSDVYSLGAVLYACLAGRAPFVGESSLETLQQVLHEEPLPLRVLNSRVPKDLETICLKCLDKEPHRRYGTSDELAADLRRFLNGHPVQARPVSRLNKSYRWARRNPWVAATAALVCLIAIASPLFALREAKLRAEADGNANLAADEAERANRSADLAEVRKQEAEENLALANKNAAEERLAKNAANAALSRVKFFLALAHWENGRVADAIKTLHEIPPGDRHLEWLIARREFEGSTATLSGHGGAVNSVVYSPDGKTVASGGSAEIRIWDAATWETIHSIAVDGIVRCLRFSRDGTRLYSSSNNRIDTWDPATGRAVDSLSTESDLDEIWSFDLHPREPILVLATHITNEPGRLEWRSLPDGSKIRSIETPRHGFRHVHFSPAGKRIATVGFFSGLAVWNSDTGQSLWKRDRLGTDAAFAADGSSLAMTQTYMGWSIHDPETGEELQQGPSVSSQTVRSAQCLKFNPLGTRLAIAYHDGEIGIINLQSESHTRYQGHQKSVVDLAFSPDASTLASVSEDGTVKLWDLDADKAFGAVKRVEKETSLVRTFLEGSIAEMPRLALGNSEVDLSVGKLGQKLALAGFGKDVEIRNTTDLRIEQTLNDHPDFVLKVAINADETQLAVACVDKSLCLWDLSSGKRTHVLRGHRDLMTDLQFSRDGRILFSSSLDGDICVWDVRQGRRLRTLREHRMPVRALSVADAGDVFVGVGSGGVLSVWDIQSGSLVRRLQIGGALMDVEFLPNSPLVCVTGYRSQDSGITEIWDTQTGECVGRFDAGTRKVVSVAISDHANRLLTCDDQGVVKLWDVKERQELLSYDDYNFAGKVAFCHGQPKFFLARPSHRTNSGSYYLPMSVAELRMVQGVEITETGDIHFGVPNLLSHRDSPRQLDRLLRSALSCRKQPYAAASILGSWLTQSDPSVPHFEIALKVFHRSLSWWRERRMESSETHDMSEAHDLLPEQVREVLSRYPTASEDVSVPEWPDPAFESEMIRWYETRQLVESVTEQVNNKQFPEARRILRGLIDDAKRLTKDPRMVVARVPYVVSLERHYKNLAHLELSAERPKARRAVLQELAQIFESGMDQDNPTDWNLLATLWFDLHQLDAAAKAFQRCLSLSGKSEMVPLLGEFSDFVPAHDFITLNRLMRSRRFKPAQIEGRTIDDQVMYRARYEPWDGTYYYHWGKDDASFRRLSENIQREGLMLVEPFSFQDAAGEVLHCAVWEFPRPSVEQTRIEGEAFYRIAWSGGDLLTPAMTEFNAATWSQDEQLLWMGGTSGDELELGFRVQNAGQFDVSAVFTTASDYGIVNLYFDDELVAESLDLFRPGDVTTVANLHQSLGMHRLEEGKHRIRVVMKDCHPEAVDRFGFGLDFVEFKRVKGATSEESDR